MYVESKSCLFGFTLTYTDFSIHNDRIVQSGVRIGRGGGGIYRDAQHYGERYLQNRDRESCALLRDARCQGKSSGYCACDRSHRQNRVSSS